MDNRKLNTAQALAAGVLNIDAPESGTPKDLDWFEVEEREWNEDQLSNELDNHGGLCGTMYFGCWRIWTSDNGFSGELMQYRAVTDSFQDQPKAHAVDKAAEWAAGCQG